MIFLQVDLCLRELKDRLLFLAWPDTNADLDGILLLVVHFVWVLDLTVSIMNIYRFEDNVSIFILISYHYTTLIT